MGCRKIWRGLILRSKWLLNPVTLVTPTARYGIADYPAPGNQWSTNTDENAPDCVRSGVGSPMERASRQGEGNDARPGCAGRRAAPYALAGGREDLCLRRAERQGQPARPVRRSQATRPVPRIFRTRRAWLA